MKKSTLILIAIGALFVLQAQGCSLFKKDEPQDTSTSEEEIVPLFVENSTESPTDSVQSLIGASQKNEDQGKYLSPYLENSTNLLPPSEFFAETPATGVPLEFGNDMIVRAIYTDVDGNTQRYAYFLHQTEDGWKIYHVQRAGSMATPTASPDLRGVVFAETPVAPQEVAAKKAQMQNGLYEWRTNHYLTALGDSIAYGFDPHENSYTILTDPGDGTGAPDTAVIEVIHEFEFYQIVLVRSDDIWSITKVEPGVEREF
jgi:hypothetical protein